MAGSSETRTADGIGTGETAGSEDSARIAGEASHAAGNLIHRLYYLAEVIEGDSGSDDIPEALSELKEALGELHTLVARSMALLRPVKVETTRYSCVDIALSIAQGFGGDGSEIKAETPSPVLDELTGREADVDPTQLAHAVGLLSDVLHGEKPETARSGLICIRTAIRTVFDSKEAAGKKVFGFFVTVLKPRTGTLMNADRDDVGAALAVAVASRILGTFECEVIRNNDGPHDSMSIFVPAIRTP